MCLVPTRPTQGSSRQPAQPSPSCPSYMALPRPCCRITWDVDRGYRELQPRALRRCDTHRGTPAVSLKWHSIKRERGTRWNAAERPCLLVSPFHTTQQRAAASHESLQKSARVRLLLPSYTPRYASRFARVWMWCVGRTSKAEYCELSTVVIHHILTHRALGCGGTARGSRRNGSAVSY